MPTRRAYGLLKISSTQDVRFSPGAIEEGRKLANKLWNVSRLILANAALVTPTLHPHALEERWILARIEAVRAEVEEAWARFDFATATRRSTTSRSTTSATGTPRRSSRGSTTARRTRSRPRSRRSSGCSRSSTRCCRTSPRRSGRTCPIARARLIVSPWPEPDPACADAVGALDRVQAAAQTFRRSGVAVELLGTDDERRIFNAVVRPERQKARGDVEAERARSLKEIARAEMQLANERFVANAPLRWSYRRARELRALPLGLAELADAS